MASQGEGNERERRFSTQGGRGYDADSDSERTASEEEIFGCDRSGSRRTVPSHSNRSRRGSEPSVSNTDRRGRRRTRAAHRHVTGEPGVENTLKLLHDVMIQAMGSRPERTETTEVSKLLTTMKNIGSYKFKGGMDPMEANKWLTSIEKNFRAMACPEAFQKQIAIYYLEGDAADWWEGIERQRGQTIMTYEEFKKEFERKYFPPEAKHRLERQFMNLVQGDKSVREYESEFTRLRKHVFDGREDEGTMIRNFMYGLKPEIGSRLAGSNFSNLTDLVEKAVNVEIGVAAEYKIIPPSGEHSKASQGEKKGFSKGGRFNKGKGRVFGGQASVRSNSVTCYSCGQSGHISRNCPSNPQSNQQGTLASRLQSVTCYSCGQKGHFASACSVNKPIPATPLTVRTASSRPAHEPASKKQNVGGRVYALDIANTETPGPSKGPITGNLHV